MSELELVAPPDASTFWADPFLVKRNGETWLFFEDFPFSANRGVISCVRITPDGFDSYHVVLDLPYHLSYPFLFEHGGELYMIPETHHNRAIEMWRCVEFPGRWEKQRTIFSDISAVDTTLLQHDGRWWLFTNMDRTGVWGNYWDELFVYHTDDPVHGDWTPHSANPVVSDGRWGRMGGGFLRSPSGQILRCAQIGGVEYGSGLAYLELLTLTTATFEERLVEAVYPNWQDNLVGMHHCHQVDGFTIFDRCVRVPRVK